MSWTDVTNNGNTDKIPYTKFDKGGTKIRILDNEPYSFWNHWLSQQKTSVTCIGKDCPICKIIKQQKDNNLPKTFSSSRRHALRIWNYKTEQMEILIQGQRFFTDLLVLHKEIGDVTTYDIKVIRNGDGTETTYNLLPQQVEPFDAEGKNIIEMDVADQLQPPTYEEMVMLINGKTWEEINASKKESEDDEDVPFDDGVANAS